VSEAEQGRMAPVANSARGRKIARRPRSSEDRTSNLEKAGMALQVPIDRTLHWKCKVDTALQTKGYMVNTVGRQVRKVDRSLVE
jgi:hypothetical protein